MIKRSYARHPDFDKVVKAYRDRYGIDLSHMRMRWSKHPVYIDGRRSYDFGDDETGGSWRNDSSIAINPDMKSVMERFGITGQTQAEFRRRIIAHELAHEVWHKKKAKELIRVMLEKAKEDNFTTPYLQTVPDRKMDEETFAEYMSDQLNKKAEKAMPFPEDEVDYLKGRDRIVTHRVSKERGRYDKGDVVATTWGDRYEVSDRSDLRSVDDSPYAGFLTPEQRKALLKKKIALLVLKRLEKKAESRLYTYLPKDNTVDIDGLLSTALSKDGWKKYRGRTRRKTREAVLRALDAMEPDWRRSMSVSALAEPIPDDAAEDLKEFARSNRLYSFDVDDLVKAKILKHLRETNRGKGTHEAKSVSRGSPDWKRKPGKLLFRGIPHYMVEIEGGRIPSKLIRSEKKSSSSKRETYESGEGEVESYTPDKTEGHDEIVVRLKDGRRIRISNNTRLGKLLRAKAGSRIGYHGWRVDGTNVVHRVHPNAHSRGGWLERLPQKA